MTPQEKTTQICKNDTHLLDIPEVQEIIKEWEKDSNMKNNVTMWEITFLDSGIRKYFTSNNEGILSAIEDYCSEGWSLFQIISIKRSEIVK